MLKNTIKILTYKYFYNCPNEIIENKNALFFQLQKCYWDYMDIYKEQNSNLPSYTEKEFMKLMVDHTIFLFIRIKNFNKEYKEWIDYINKIPVYGTVLIDKSYKNCLLLATHYYKNELVYGFPKGKINGGELPIDCAIRETYEETGLNVSEVINENEYVEAVIRGRCIRLYIIYNVDSTSISFKPQNKGEVIEYKWFSINNLPLNQQWIILVDKIKDVLSKKVLYMEYGLTKSKFKKEIKNRKKDNKYIAYLANSYLVHPINFGNHFYIQ
jgi:8-oxo-dGTP pyrophosphatase MutT (NUDIX family)